MLRIHFFPVLLITPSCTRARINLRMLMTSSRIFYYLTQASNKTSAGPAGNEDAAVISHPPAAALLSHLATVRRSIREIFNPHAADPAGALADANMAVESMAPGPAPTAEIVGQLERASSNSTPEAGQKKGSGGGGGSSLHADFKTASRWEHEVRSRSSMLARMFGDALATKAQIDDADRLKQPSKRRKIDENPTATANASFKQLQTSLSEMFSGTLELVHAPTVGCQHILEATLPGVLSAKLAMRWDGDALLSPGLWSIERVMVHGIAETGAAANATASSVFQQVTASANKAALAYSQRGGQDRAGGGRGVADFLRWLATYQNLFAAKCHKCQRILRAENNDYLPPTHRAIDGEEMGVPFHATCAAVIVNTAAAAN